MSIHSRCRGVFLATVFATALTGAASAADLAYKAAPLVAPVPVYSWTGIYLGVSGGTGWGTKDVSFDQDATANAIAALLAVPNPWTFGLADSSHTFNGGFLGGQIGYNYQAGWAVFGIQADWYWADLEGKGAANAGTFTDLILGLGTTASARTEVKSFGSVTGRLGAALDRTLIYVKGGVAWEDSDDTLTLHGLLVNGCPAPGSCSATNTVGLTRTGWTFGAGIEQAFTPNWSAFVEYNYYDFDTEWVNRNYNFALNLVNLPVNTEVGESFHTIKAGINYKFNWGAPVVARY